MPAGKGRIVSSKKDTKTADTANIKLAEFMCFAIYSANLAYGKAYKPILEKLGLTYTQYIALVALWEEDDQTVSGLGDRLSLESNTLTPVLKKLEALGYVRRQRSSADERQVRVSLTETGYQLRQKVAAKELIAATGLDPDDLREAQKTVTKIRDNLIRATQGGRGK